MTRRNKILISAGIATAFLLISKSTSMRSFLGLVDMPRGIRNNNPGNIVINSNNNWKGKIPLSQNTDGHFEQFSALPYGIRALIKLLRTYHAQGYNTIEKIITKYAPAWENNTNAYIASVEAQTGVSRYDLINVDSFIMLKSLVKAISRHENGGNYLNDQDIFQAWQLL